MTAGKDKPLPAGKALERLMALCAGAEHCTFDMMTRLQRWGINPDERSRIIARLCREKFVDNRRFAISYAIDKARSNAWGSRKIRLGLMQKRISADDISAALAEVDPEDFRTGLLLTIRSKILSIGAAEAATYDGRTRIFRHAASRGFDPEMITGILHDRKLMEELSQ